MEQKMRVRYGRVENLPKNTLVTIRDGEKIFFGIARCRLSADTAMKAEGKRWASFRALRQWSDVASNIENAGTTDGSLFINTSGMQGHVNIADVQKLLEYFENVDRIQAKKISKG